MKVIRLSDEQIRVLRGKVNGTIRYSSRRIRHGSTNREEDIKRIELCKSILDCFDNAKDE